VPSLSFFSGLGRHGPLAAPLRDVAIDVPRAFGAGELRKQEVLTGGASLGAHPAGETLREDDLIHPHREAREASNVTIDTHTAEALYNVLCLVLRDLAKAAKNG
jgi:hypothetical protein